MHTHRPLASSFPLRLYSIGVLLLLLGPAVYGQDLDYVVRAVHPALYLNNSDNRRVYRQSMMDRNHLIFSRGFRNRTVEEIEESYHYNFLNERRQRYLLERRFNRYDFSAGMQAIPSSDFGIKIYRLMEGEQWEVVTHEVLPDDFEARLLEQFPDLQPGSIRYYYYNQNPACVADMEFERRFIHFKKQGRTVLRLRWKRGRFVWR